MDLENITKVYMEGTAREVKVLNGISISFKSNKMYGIMGRSGSGKTTLINILGLLDKQSTGKYHLNSVDISQLSENEKAKLRNQEIGFVFQSYFLDSKLTAIENVLLPTLINKDYDKKIFYEKALTLLKKLGLENRKDHYPNELSGGECQRVAIARALINDPSYIIADEPTGNLDSKSEKEILEILKKISQKNKCVIIVSHNDLIKEYCDKIYYLTDEGKIKNEL